MHTLLLACALTLLPAPATTPSFRLVEFTGDALPDKLLMLEDGSLQLEVNHGGGLFLPVEQTLPRIHVAEVLAGDFNGDGMTDLYLVSPRDNALLIGDGFGLFRDDTALLGVTERGFGVSAERLDVDGDGALDLLIHNKNSDVLFWWRPSLGRFEREGLAAGAGGPTLGDASGSDLLDVDLGADSGTLSGLGSDAGSGDKTAGKASAQGGVFSTLTPTEFNLLVRMIVDKLKAVFILDEMNQVDAEDVLDYSLTGPDVSTLSGDIVHLGGRMGVGTASPQSELDVVGSVSVGGTPVIDNTGRWVVTPRTFKALPALQGLTVQPVRPERMALLGPRATPVLQVMPAPLDPMVLLAPWVRPVRQA